jgi:hypothetical protein
MNFQEIKAHLIKYFEENEDYGGIEQFAHEDFDDNDLGLGPVKQVFRKGGMDQGSDWQRVYHFVDHDVYIKVDGYYSSYCGTEFEDGWDSLSEVRPKEVTITIFE